MSKVKKEKTIGFRVNEFENNRINVLSDLTGEKKSKIIRQAINDYYIRKIAPYPVSILGTNEFNFCLSCMNNDQIKKFARINFDNGLQSIETLARLYLEVDPATLRVGLQYFLTIYFKNTLIDQSKTIDSVEWEWLEGRKKVRIIGKHRMNENLSLFIKYVTKYWLESQKFMKYKYSMTMDVTLDGLFIFELTKEES